MKSKEASAYTQASQERRLWKINEGNPGHYTIEWLTQCDKGCSMVSSNGVGMTREAAVEIEGHPGHDTVKRHTQCDGGSLARSNGYVGWHRWHSRTC